MRKVIITDIDQVVTYNSDIKEMTVLENVDIAIEGDQILEVGKDLYSQEYKRINGKGFMVTPGLVDSHTHPVFAETREVEFEMRSQGKSYQEIAAAGGGILNSVRKFRALPDKKLKEMTRKRLMRFFTFGTTTIEAKSGYGLNFKDEIRSLKILKELHQEIPLTIIPTFLGAHEIPDEYKNNRQGYIRLIESEIIPYIAEHNLAEFCDVFCEEGVFTAAETKQIFTKANEYGLKLRLHADEFKSIGGIEVAIEMEASSVDHLSAITDESIKKLKESRLVPVILPGTTFFLGSTKYAPARKMWDAGLPVALATDYNPGSCHTQSLQFIMTVACVYLKLTPLEALQAVTYNAALSLQRENIIGAIQPGMKADLIIWKYSDYRKIPYYLCDNGIYITIKSGKIIWTNPQ